MHSYSLTELQKQQVVERTNRYILLANRLLQLDLTSIAIKFDLKGKSSGMFVVRPGEVYIRYNEIIFAAYFEDALISTVAHEVAHYVVHSIYGVSNVKPHGKEWQHVMGLFELKAEVTSRYDITDLPLRQQNRHAYSCSCMNHQLSTTRHNKVQRKKAVYYCRQCQQRLAPVSV